MTGSQYFICFENTIQNEKKFLSVQLIFLTTENILENKISFG